MYFVLQSENRVPVQLGSYFEDPIPCTISLHSGSLVLEKKHT
ncbi:hypothetical protein SAMN04488057_106108 [Cyclobacterium lianum]|uniref:Uncharacterized protein n=1 Tax=Cyclobacterium lianum TaxID=388280 RepID=A0A1M7NVT8_9BACT|nr:hypothetical protein SAMN04488057_106108 [Cyclobacterium lianum]